MDVSWKKWIFYKFKKIKQLLKSKIDMKIDMKINLLVQSCFIEYKKAFFSLKSLLKLIVWFKRAWKSIQIQGLEILWFINLSMPSSKFDLLRYMHSTIQKKV